MAWLLSFTTSFTRVSSLPFRVVYLPSFFPLLCCFAALSLYLSLYPASLVSLLILRGVDIACEIVVAVDVDIDIDIDALKNRIISYHIFHLLCPWQYTRAKII